MAESYPPTIDWILARIDALEHIIVADLGHRLGFDDPAYVDVLLRALPNTTLALAPGSGPVAQERIDHLQQLRRDELTRICALLRARVQDINS